MDEKTRRQYEAAKQRYNDPGVQRRIARIKQRVWDEHTLPPSRVFGQRLRETRAARGLSLAGLSARMTAYGHPIGVRALHEIETGKRRLLIDEAFALTEVLQAVVANMLIPPEGTLVRLGPGHAVDGSGMRTWLVSGLQDVSTQPPAPEIADDVRREETDRRIARLAQIFIDAYRVEGSDGESARAEALRQLAREVRASSRKKR